MKGLEGATIGEAENSCGEVEMNLNKVKEVNESPDDKTEGTCSWARDRTSHGGPFQCRRM